jgi:exodeoxyribonuclease VII large subunit
MAMIFCISVMHRLFVLFMDTSLGHVLEQQTVFTVSSLTRVIKDTLEKGLGVLSVSGEISNFVRHSSGHWYFTLKDQTAQLSCVMFRGNANSIFFQPRNGMEVVCRGRLSVYEPRGQYQLVASSMQPRGEGALQLAFEQLKRSLHAEGLFDPERKRPLALYPEVVALLTSPTGAAVRDMISVITRRNPAVQLLVVPVQVQGAGAAESIVEGLQRCNRYKAVDVIIAGRGGGSIEDLWAFNEESVARAIAASHIPVVSAVGHEIDFTIADYVADLRAATPSVAGELVVPALDDIVQSLRDVTMTTGKFVHSLLQQRTEEFRSALADRAMSRLAGRLGTLAQLTDERSASLHRQMERRIERSQYGIDMLRERLAANDPDRYFRRGAVLLEKDGQRISSAAQVAADDDVCIRLRDGNLHATVTSVNHHGQTENNGN